MPPDIQSSTREERLKYLRETFWCRGDCDSCGLCQVFHGKDPLIVYEDYLAGKRTFQEISAEYRGRF